MSFEDCATKFRCTISKQMEDEEKEKKKLTSIIQIY